MNTHSPDRFDPDWIDPDRSDPDWVDTVRADTPGTNHVVHFNNAGVRCPRPRWSRPWQLTPGGKPRSVATRRRARRSTARASAYASLAALINTDAENIAVVERDPRLGHGGLRLPVPDSDRVLTARAEYASNATRCCSYDTCMASRSPSSTTTSTGRSRISSRSSARAQMVALTHAPTNGGLINPADGAARWRVLRARCVPVRGSTPDRCARDRL